MAGATTELKIKVLAPGAEKLPGLARSFQSFGNDVKKAGFSVAKLSKELRLQANQGTKSINNTRALANTWRELAANVEVGSRAFNHATRQAAKLDAQLLKMQASGGGLRGRLPGIAKTAGAIAGSAVFGGPAGAAGSAIGAAMGGLPGAIAGGAIGAQVGMVGQVIGEVAEYDAALEKQRKALRLVIADTNQYNDAQEFLSQTSEELAIPQDVIVRQFTQLAASVKGAGGNIEDAKDSFRAIASGIRGTGGNLEDMRAAMVATSQVFSKGKVSAEELRQQLGERLPGAFTLFAESMGKTPAELDKALEGGKVTLQDFMEFADKLNDEYFENAKKLAAGPEAAGDRLKTSMSDLKDSLGDILRPIGAAFQNTFAAIVQDIAEAINMFNRFFGIGLDNAIAKTQLELKKAREREESLQGATGPRGKASLGRAINTRMRLEEKLNKLLKEREDLNNNNTKSLRDQLEVSESLTESISAGATQYLTSIKSLAERIGEAVSSAFKGMEDALVKFVMTGKLEFRSLTLSILQDMARIAVQQAITAPFSAMLGNLFAPNAKGNIYAQNGIVPFAKGGVVNSPHVFPFKNGIGLLGEAGPEAIMPLRRGPGGRLGVESSGGGGANVTVNVDASGSPQVKGDGPQAATLGRLIGNAIQEELIKQRRHGGILS